MRKICWWLGTDSYILTHMPPGRLMWKIRILLYRIKWFFLHRIFDQHWIVGERLRDELTLFGIPNNKISVVPDSPQEIKNFVKNSHIGFVVLYYMPIYNKISGRKYRDWVYGADIINSLKRIFSSHPYVVFMCVNGQANMNGIYSITDFYVRPTRHDGQPRMIDECKQLGIPYYYSENGNPDVLDIVTQIKKEYERTRYGIL